MKIRVDVGVISGYHRMILTAENAAETCQLNELLKTLEFRNILFREFPCGIGTETNAVEFHLLVSNAP